MPPNQIPGYAPAEGPCVAFY